MDIIGFNLYVLLLH